MRAYTDEIAAEIHGRHANVVEIDVGESVLVLRLWDQAETERWINESLRSVPDGATNAVTRALVWPTQGELAGLRRRYRALDSKCVEILAGRAGDPLGRVAVDELNADTPPAVLQQAGLTSEQASQYARSAADQHRSAVVAYASYGPDEPGVGLVIASPREADMVALESNEREARNSRAQAYRTLAVGCTIWTSEGEPVALFKRRPALPLALYQHVIRDLEGSGAIRARKSAGRRGAGPSPGS